MSRIPAFPWKLFIAAATAWALYLVLSAAGWSSAAVDSVSYRVQSAVLEMLLFGGWAALIVGLAGWMLAEGEGDRDDARAAQLIESGLGVRLSKTGGPEDVAGSVSPE